MIQNETKFHDFKQRLINLYNQENLINELKKDPNLNRNFQFQIYLLFEIQKDDDDLIKIINELKKENITIHIFNEYLSNEQIFSLLESNFFKINKSINDSKNINPLFELQQELENIKKIDENRTLKLKYRECFEKSKKTKWFKKTRKQAVVTTMFLALFTKKRDQKLKSLMNDVINNLNSDFDLKIDNANPNEEFIKEFYEYFINWSIKKSLHIILLVLIIIFVIALSTILICVL